ncbi:MAG: D-2-hydroxyacid dehydrogenase [Bacillati bacterium ANGP1]|uniref:D-2-hydroxyacid dehydrogenase n=1 Tax=Candidatus Segetimicrobium genomatis TaxID=2569760 RepID=A0A537JPH7_9BACT|nr:MAG: D-2-hydroxyacid dehydrogenase [Terrabacteria group bacterium ANGP1]
MPTTNRRPVLIASYLEPEYVERVARVEGVHVIYEPGLLPEPRYTCDHHGAPLRRDGEHERRWRDCLARAEVMFDFDYTNIDHLRELIPNVRWIQATSAGIGQLLLRTGLIDAPITFTTARGIHGVPLAEFALMAMLWFAKGGPRIVRDQAAHRWERTCARELRGATVGIVGLGGVGGEVGRSCRALGLRVIATRRTGPDAGEGGAADVVLPPTGLPTLLREADVLVLSCPHTPETEGLIGAEELAMLKPGAVLINIARGAVVDEPALIDALRSGRLGAAALDVAAEEPLPAGSPLWDLPNVLVSPHSASTVVTENAKLTDLFCENLRRYIRGDPLLNVFDRTRLY